VSDVAASAEHASAIDRLRGIGSAGRGALAFLLYLALACLVWLPPIGGAIASRYVGDGWADARLYRWALGWTPWAILHGHSPLFASNVFTPDGLNLTWVTFVPSLGIVTYPLQRLLGSLITLNVLMLLAPALAAWATYLVCYRVTGRFWPSVLGGLFLGSSSYLAGHMVDHLNLVMVFPVPLAVYLVVRRVEGSLGTVAFVGWLAADLLLLFGISTELFATATLFGAVAIVLALAFAGSDRPRLLSAMVLMGMAYLIVGVLLLPFVLDAVRHEPSGVLRPIDKTSIDLASWITPRNHEAIGGDSFTDVTSRFTASSQEDAGYVGVAAVAMLGGFLITERRRRSTWALFGFLVVVVVLASGPVLRVLGEATITMPGKLLTEVPLLQHATPQRFPVYAALALGVIAAVWVSRGSGRTAWVRWAIAALAVVALVPRPDPSAFHANGATPGFFSSGDVRAQIHEGENVFAITERPGTELEWLASSDFWYQVPQGYVGPVPAAYAGQPLYRGLAGVQLNPYVPRPEDLANWLSERGVTAVLLDDDVAWKFSYLLQTVGLRQVHQGDGVSVWRPGPHGYNADDPADVVVNGDLDHVGGELRAFSFPSLVGGDRIAGPLDGETLFSFVGPDCSTCEQHLDALRSFAEAHPDVRVIAVSSWDPDLRNADLIRSLGLGYEVAQDPLGRMATAADADTLPDVSPPTPFSILVGTDGSVQAVYRGVWSAGTAPAPIASYTGP
jgi:hypothetical protein